NGDVLVAQSYTKSSIPKQIGATLLGAGGANTLKNSAAVITILRDTDNNGTPDVRQTSLTKTAGLNQPCGMLVIGEWLYVANTGAVLRYPYKAGQTRITTVGEKIADLPAGKVNQHWTRNIIA